MEDRVGLRTWLEVDTDAIRNNIAELMKNAAPSVKVCATIKADGYGHGAVELAKRLKGTADYYAVSCEYEALELAEAGITEPILILGKTWPANYPELLRYGIRMNIYTEEDGKALSEAAVRLGKTAYVHFSVNTGMNRIGFQPTEESADAVVRIAALPGIAAEGLFSHFATADEEDETSADLQWERYCGFRRMLEQRGLKLPIYHMANSATASRHPERDMDMARLGISLYGISALCDPVPEPAELRQAISFKSRVSLVKQVAAGEGVGYGLTFVAKDTRTIATVPVGYADGYMRTFSNRAYVLIRGQKAPVAGRVCMDQMMVDVTDIPGVEAGDIVTLFGYDGDQFISVADMAAMAGTIPHEVLVNLSRKRVPHIYIS